MIAVNKDPEKTYSYGCRIYCYNYQRSLAGTRAITNCKPRQARKGAAAAMDLCAVVLLARALMLDAIMNSNSQRLRFFSNVI